MWLRVAAGCVVQIDLPQLIHLVCVLHLGHLFHND
jgi:hypothetical protein